MEFSDTLTAAKAGDPVALGHLMEDAAGFCWRVLTRFNTLSQATREDLVHEVFVEAYLSLRTYKAHSPFLHWLRKIAVRVGYRYWKGHARAQIESVSLSAHVCTILRGLCLQ